MYIQKIRDGLWRLETRIKDFSGPEYFNSRESARRYLVALQSVGGDADRATDQVSLIPERLTRIKVAEYGSRVEYGHTVVYVVE